MKTLLVQAKNKKHLAKIKAALKLVEADFTEQLNTITNPELIENIEAARKQKVEGTLIKLTPELKKELFGL